MVDKWLVALAKGEGYVEGVRLVLVTQPAYNSYSCFRRLCISGNCYITASDLYKFLEPYEMEFSLDDLEVLARSWDSQGIGQI